MSIPTRHVLHGGCLITAADSGDIKDGCLIIEGNRISGLLKASQYVTSSNDNVLDVSGSYLMPGLIDAHAHVISATAPLVTEGLIARGMIDGVISAKRAIRAGITSVRDLGCKHSGIYALRDAINRGTILGPRIWTAGRNLSGTGVVEAWRNFSFDGAVAFRRAVREEWKAGADWIKLILSDGQWGNEDIPLMTKDEAQAAVDEAHSKYLRVSAHVDGSNGVELALASGCDCIEHGVDLPQEAAAQMAKANVTYVPTIHAYAAEVLPVWKADSKLKSQAHRRSFEQALSSGVIIAAGTDVNYSKHSPTEALLGELEMMVEWGMNIEQAIRAATITPASILGVEAEIGSLEPGKRADVLVLREDPRLSLSALGTVERVYQDGRLVHDADVATAVNLGQLVQLKPKV